MEKRDVRVGVLIGSEGSEKILAIGDKSLKLTKNDGQKHPGLG
jgi:hypothetical protein